MKARYWVITAVISFLVYAAFGFSSLVECSKYDSLLSCALIKHP